MAGELLHLENMEQYRERFTAEYCDPLKPCLTFDDIWVRFFPEMFDHAFFISSNRSVADKAIFSQERAERMLWIKETLQDPTAVLKIGWVKKDNLYDKKRRVAIVKGNYTVIIQLYENEKARFITAYCADENGIKKIMSGPDWEKKKTAD